MPQIRAGRIDELRPPMGQWVFVDLGFAGERRKTNGLLIDGGMPTVHTFAELCEALVTLTRESGPPLHMVIEAPLSVAFTQRGNPTGRSIEKRSGQQPRYWYNGPGCTITTAAMYLLREIAAAGPGRELRLFEGFVSFKPKGTRSSLGDVVLLRRVVRGDLSVGQIVAPDALAMKPDHVLRSAFAVAGLDYGVPPVVVGNTVVDALPH